MIADGDNENTFTDFGRVDDFDWWLRLGPAASDVGGDDDSSERANGGEAARGEESFPPTRLTFWKAWGDGGPDALTVIFAGVGNGQRVHGGEDGFDFFERGAAFGAGVQVI